LRPFPLTQAKALYGTLLGVAPSMDEAYYVQFNVGDQEVGLDPHGHSKGGTGPVGYWYVDDIREGGHRNRAWAPQVVQAP
jgi:hypothetical protein